MAVERREARVLAAVVTLVDSLLDDFDVVELLTELTECCAELLDVASAGLLLADPRGELHLMAATSERTAERELLALQADEGPCRDCFVSGDPTSVADIASAAPRWPNVAAAAVSAGVASVHAVPMRAAGTVVGVLGLFGTQVGQLDDADLLVAQSLAHVASVAILLGRSPAAADLTPRVHSALMSRMLVEQAKGYLSERFGVSVGEAFTLLRRFARSHGTHLTDVARELITGAQNRDSIVTALKDASGPGAQSTHRG